MWSISRGLSSGRKVCAERIGTAARTGSTARGVRSPAPTVRAPANTASATCSNQWFLHVKEGSP